jgi:transposase
MGSVLPYMASVIAKKKGNKLYYYVVESARVNGKPRIVSQAYLGTAEKLAEMVRDRAAPIPLGATTRKFGLPAALWWAAQQSGVWELLLSLWPAEKPSVASNAHYLLLAAIHRICSPGPKTEVPEWYSKSVLPSLWGFSPGQFTSQAFWDTFEEIIPADEQDLPFDEDPLDQAQLRLLGMWKEKQLVSNRILAYDTTNFYTYIASTNGRSRLAQRGHNKQGRDNLRQIGLSYVLDGENGLSLCHHVYPGNRADVDEFSTALTRIIRMLDKNQIERDSVTLVLDKGSAALSNTLALNKSRMGWISALPWNQAPKEFSERSLDQLPQCSSAQPGVRAAAERMLVHGAEYLCVIKYSSTFASEQLHSLTKSLTRVLQTMRSLSRELNKPGTRWTEEKIRKKLKNLLKGQFVGEVIKYQLEQSDDVWHLQFDFDSQALSHLMNHRLGRTVLITNRMDWTAEQVVAGYGGQQDIERVFRGLKDGDWLHWGPMYHWTDRKIRIHAFYCMLGISLLHFLHKQAQAAWPGITMEELLHQLGEINQFVLLYPPQGEKGPARTATVLSNRTLVQQALVNTLGLEKMGL